MKLHHAHAFFKYVFDLIHMLISFQITQVVVWSRFLALCRYIDNQYENVILIFLKLIVTICGTEP